MKARLLKKLLNNTGYTVAFYDTYIGIGSPLCHDLIKVDIPSFNMRYALAWPKREDRKSLDGKEELAFIWDKLEELIKSGEINDILEGNDVIENPLPVYTVKRGKLISTYTDAYGWPNVTIDGHMMHDNDYFDNPVDAIKYGIREYQCAGESQVEYVKDLQDKLNKADKRLNEFNEYVAELKQLLSKRKK